MGHSELFQSNVLLLFELLGMSISSSCSWILDSSSDVNRHLFSAAWAGRCGAEDFFSLEDEGQDRHEVGREPVVNPLGNFCAITLRPGSGGKRETMVIFRHGTGPAVNIFTLVKVFDIQSALVQALQRQMIQFGGERKHSKSTLKTLNGLQCVITKMELWGWSLVIGCL